jgi:hypothetical protein
LACPSWTENLGRDDVKNIIPELEMLGITEKMRNFAKTPR